ncbi:MAG TPA: hypothetical protein VGC45_12465 [Gryllotalpicola sp.]
MTNANDGWAERLAPWIRELPLADQVYLTGTTLILEEIRNRRGDDLPHPYDETKLREAATPWESAAEARKIAALYNGIAPHPGCDGVDDHWRISNICLMFAQTVETKFPSPNNPQKRRNPPALYEVAAEKYE